MTPESQPAVEIKRYPMSMTGAKLRRQLGIPSSVQESFKLSPRLSNVPVDRRLQYLRNRATEGQAVPWREMWNRRRSFNASKHGKFRMADNCPCYVCGKPAVLRHHVKPVSRGGRNKKSNIAPLCQACHEAIHPHLAGDVNLEL